MKYHLESDFEITLPLSPEDFREQLESNVDKDGVLKILSRSKHNHFLGKIEDFTFTIRKKLDYRNAALPNMHGNFKPCAEGTKVSINMRPDQSTYIFVTVWSLGTACLFIFSILLFGLLNIYNLVYILLFIAGNGLYYWGFWSEVNKSKQLFLNIFE